MNTQNEDARVPSPGPLSGVRVLDAGTILAAPMVGALLGDFGADVIKVEDPQGDPIRAYPPHVRNQAIGSKVTNRNKRSICLDLRSSEGQNTFRQLVADVDVVIANFRPNTLARWAIDYHNLREVNPAIVMLHLTGFGRTGENRDRPGFARIAEAYAGLTYITGSPDGPPVFAGYPVADGVGGIYGAFSVMLALYHKKLSGEGQLVDLALYEPILRMIEDMVPSYETTGKPRERHGNINPLVAPNDIYRSRDGKWIALPSSTPNMYRRLCEALGKPDLVTDGRFSDNSSRIANRENLDAILRPAIERMNAADLLHLLEKNDVAVQVVNSAREIYEEEHLWQRRSLIRVWDEHLERKIAMPGVIPHLSASPGAVRSVGPEVGEHTEQVLSELYSERKARKPSRLEADESGPR